MYIRALMNADCPKASADPGLPRWTGITVIVTGMALPFLLILAFLLEVLLA